jgi:thiamine-phosphate pyrophosphorylase
MNPYQLYLVTDDQQDLDTLTFVVEQAILGGVTAVQIREKHGDIRAFIRRAQRIKQVLHTTNIPLIINDRVDVALAVDADGVHLGQSDMPVDMARQLLGDHKILGLSIETKQQLLEAETLPINYIGLSAIFSTPTKTNTVTQWGIEGLRYALTHSRHPIVAIGGIDTSNLAQITTTGVHGVALVSAICHATHPQKATQELLQIFNHKG